MVRKGVKQIKQSPIEARYVFISPPGGDLKVLEERLKGRGTEDEKSIEKRLAQAKNELDYAATGAHDLVIYNDDLDTAYEELKSFVFKKKEE